MGKSLIVILVSAVLFVAYNYLLLSGFFKYYNIKITIGFQYYIN